MGNARKPNDASRHLWPSRIPGWVHQARGHAHEQAWLDVKCLSGGRKRRLVGVADALQVVQPEQIDVGLVGYPAIRNDPRNGLELDRIVGQVQLQKALDRAVLRWLGIIGSPDRVEPRSLPRA